MKIIVKSRERARKDSFDENLTESIAIISIYTPGDPPNHFCRRSNIKKCLYLCFHDIGNRDSTGISMTKDDANKVADFVEWCIENKIKELWVHCDAGISRSAGVAAAIMKFLTGDDSEIYDNPYRRPNSHCYTLTLQTLMEKAEK